MLSNKVTVTNKAGLHARPASIFVKEASKFKADVFIDNGNKKVNAKSILNVLTMGIVNGTEIEISAIGEDAEEAVQKLTYFIENELGE